MAYDGMLVHVAGARRGSFNHRFAAPSNQTTPLWGHAFPYADLPIEDPLTGNTKGLLDAVDADGCVPKIIYTDIEYWRGDAALAHIDTWGDKTCGTFEYTTLLVFGHPTRRRVSRSIARK